MVKHKGDYGAFPTARRRCAVRGKVIFDFRFDAEAAAVEQSRFAGIPLTAYKDSECEHWHITKNEWR